MTGSKDRKCPLCGLLVLRSHHCRASSLVPTNVPPVGVQTALLEPLADSTPRRRPRRVPNECPDHPGSGERSWDCKHCEAEAVPGQAASLLANTEEEAQN